jgi:hypothetical protein
MALPGLGLNSPEVASVIQTGRFTRARTDCYRGSEAAWRYPCRSVPGAEQALRNLAGDGLAFGRLAGG